MQDMIQGVAKILFSPDKSNAATDVRLIIDIFFVFNASSSKAYEKKACVPWLSQCVCVCVCVCVPRLCQCHK